MSEKEPEKKRITDLPDSELLKALFGERGTEQLKREMREKGLIPESETGVNLPPMPTD